MKPINRTSKLVIAGLCGLWLSVAGQAISPPAMSVTPVDPTISVGQTQQFTSSGNFTAAAVSAGGEYTCVRLPDATAQCVGRNQFGQLGDGSWTDSSILVPVSGLTNAAQVAAADEFGCALLADGTGMCWGLGEQGQRGDGTFDQISLVPVAISGLTNGVSIAGGYNHACALLADGTMRCWGSNASGQLGDPLTPVSSAVPVAVSGISGATAMTAGAFHSCALLADRTLRCWGSNSSGQLGDDTTTDSSTPVPVNGIANGVAMVSGGGAHTCALLVDGTVQCWGGNDDGQVGDGNPPTWSSDPVRVAGITNAVAVSAGWLHTCALLQDGTIQCWGGNQSGQLGDGTTTSSSTPVQVRGITGAVAVTAGWYHHSCALLGDGTVRCWGMNMWGQFGDATTTGSSVPVTMTGTGVTWTSSNPAVATINATGRATALSGGTTTITAADNFGASASTTLTVRSQAALSAIAAGTGSGTVSSNPPGISCGTNCTALFDVGTSVTLSASPDSRSTFDGWSGCDAVSGTTCTVTVNAATTVTARFELKRFTLTVNKTGVARDQGNVSSSPSGISCGTDCSESYTIDTVVRLTASPDLLFQGWSGCDSVSGTTCTVTMRSERSVSVNFLGMPF